MTHAVPKRPPDLLGFLNRSLEDGGLKFKWSGTCGSGVIGAGEGGLLTSVFARETSVCTFVCSGENVLAAAPIV